MVLLSAVMAVWSLVPHEPHVAVATIASAIEPGMLIASALQPPPEKFIGNSNARS